jgi:hypothetical protein
LIKCKYLSMWRNKSHLIADEICINLSTVALTNFVPSCLATIVKWQKVPLLLRDCVISLPIVVHRKYMNNKLRTLKPSLNAYSEKIHTTKWWFYTVTNFKLTTSRVDKRGKMGRDVRCSVNWQHFKSTFHLSWQHFKSTFHLSMYSCINISYTYTSNVTTI